LRGKSLAYHHTRAWESAAPANGRVIEASSGFAPEAITDPGVRRFVNPESDLATMLLIIGRSGFHPRVVTGVHRSSAQVHARRCTDEDRDPRRAPRML
jgi:hypothetical protein